MGKAGKPKPQKVDLRELLAPEPKAAAASRPACASWGSTAAKPASFAPPARPKPKTKPKLAARPVEAPAELAAGSDEVDAAQNAGDDKADETVGDELSKCDGPALVEETSAAAKAAVAKRAKANAKADKEQEKKAAAAAAQAKQLEGEVEAARVNAVKLRSKKGAFNGTIEVGPFSLPNPGGGLDLLENVSFNMSPGRRYGLIGRNGKGKSTLLRYMAARRVGGMPPEVTVHYVSQDVSFSAASMEQTPSMTVLEADVERRLLLAEAAALEGKTTPEEVDRLQACVQQLEAIEADTAEDRATQLLINLGFNEELRSRKLRELSGGWRVRVALAAALFGKPDVLLLDEPTNHLSIQAVMWLSNELSTSQTWESRIVVVVSHDRVFVDEACTDMLHISGVAKRLTASKGNYSTWIKRRQEQQKARERQLDNEHAEQEKLKDYSGHGFKYGGSSSQINMMMKMKRQMEKNEVRMAEEAEELADLNEDADLPLTLLAGGVLDGPAVTLQKVGFAYPGTTCSLFRGAEFTIDGKSRVVFVGENGNGKTTLVKLLLGDLQPTEGTVTRNRGARIALVNQHHAEQIDLTMTPLQFMMRKFPGDGSYAQELALRSHLAECGCPAEQQQVTASALSGGQRSRVAMAAVSFEKPHVIVMDEPTNNLDLGSIEALAQSLKDFKGGVVIVSHDQYFVQQVAQEVWNVSKGAVKRVESFEAYRARILSKMKR